MNSIYILLGGDGYYGRNFQYYLSQKGIKFIVIDKNEISFAEGSFKKDNFYENELIKKCMIKYIQHDLNDKIKINELNIEFKNKNDKIIIINFAAISFVDYSILHPNETIKNNLNCCINGYKLFLNLNNSLKYIYVSTDEVNVNKSNKELSPYVISKRKCEDFLKSLENSNLENIIILRPVNLMDVIETGICGLKQKNKCLLNKIVDVINENNIDTNNENENENIDVINKNENENINNKNENENENINNNKNEDINDKNDKIINNDNNKNIDVINENECLNKIQIHGTGEQKRMFMTMNNACDILFEISFKNVKDKIIDVTKISNKRTTDLKIKDIVLYLKNIYNFEIEYINDPRGIYQDKSYLNVENNESNNSEIKNDLKLISNVISRTIN